MPALKAVYSSLCAVVTHTFYRSIFLTCQSCFFFFISTSLAQARCLVESAGRMEKAFGDGAVSLQSPGCAGREGPLPLFPVSFFFISPGWGGGRQCQVHARTTAKLRHEDKM